MHLIFRTALMLCTMLVFVAQALAADVRSYAVLPFKVNGSSGFTYLEKAILDGRDLSRVADEAKRTAEGGGVGHTILFRKNAIKSFWRFPFPALRLRRRGSL